MRPHGSAARAYAPAGRRALALFVTGALATPGAAELFRRGTAWAAGIAPAAAAK